MVGPVLNQRAKETVKLLRAMLLRVVLGALRTPSDGAAGIRHRRDEQLHGVRFTCACRKSNPNILVMQPAQDWKAKNTPCSLNRAR